MLLKASLCFVFVLLPAFAQLDRGALTGTITDATGSLIPNAALIIQNSATGVQYETASSAAGQFTMPNLPAGPYRITVTHPGMKQFVRSGLELGATQVLRVDLVLEVGAVGERVEVSAELPRLQTDSPELGTSISNATMIDLPLSFSGSRHIENFAYKLSPGVSGSTWTSHINGSTSFSKEVLLDGAPTTTYMSGDMSSSSVSIEAIQEFKIQTSGISAEYGRTQVGLFNYVLKGGTNEFHGSGFAALRNEALNANSFANKQRGAARALDRKRTWAFSAGGPIYLPRVYDGRNKSFFYIARESYYQRDLSFGAPNVTAPLPEFYDGDFSRLLGPATGQRDALNRDVLRGAIYDPATFRQLEPGGRWIGDVFPGNRIPALRFSQVSQKLNAIAKTSLLPTVRDASGQIPLSNNMYHPSGTPKYIYTPLTVKSDQVLTSRHKLSGSYIYVDQPRWLLDAPTHLWDIASPTGGPLSRLRIQTLTSFFERLAEDWTISPRMLNHVTVFYNRYVNRDLAGPDDQQHVDGAQLLGIRNLSTAGRGIPVVNWGGGPFVTLNSTGNPQSGGSNTGVSFGLIDTFSFSAGRHFMKAGADLRRNHYNQRQNPWPSFTFASRSTAIPNEPFSGNLTGYSFASYLLGIVDSAGYSDPVGFGQRRHYFSLFFQDDFKVSNRLSLNLGLRWEYQPPAVEVSDRVSNWNPGKRDPESGLGGAYDFAGSCNVCTGKRYFGRKSFRNFSPRLGLAYRLRDKWTIRAAYGILYEADLFNNFGIPMGKAGSVQVGGTWNFSADAVNPWRGIFNWDDGFPLNLLTPPAYDVSWGNRNRPGMYDPDYGRTGYSQQWNLNVQRELPGRLILDLGYVGNKGSGFRVAELARPNQLPVSTLAQYGARLNNAVTNAAQAAANGINYPYASFTGTVGSAIRQWPQVQGSNTVNIYGSPLGFASHHALQVTLNRQFGQGISAYANYVWSKTLTNYDSSMIGDNTGPLDYYNLGLEKSVVNYDIPHMFKAYVDYELPGRRGKGRALNALLGGWNVSAILNYFSGTPLRFLGSAPLSGSWNGATNRANVAAGPLKVSSFDKSQFELSTANSPNNTYLDKSKFTDPAPLTLGTSGRYLSNIRNFGTISEDFGLMKKFNITEKIRAQLRAEFLNMFNRHNLSGINTTVTSPQFGQVTGVTGPRTIQVSTRVDF